MSRELGRRIQGNKSELILFPSVVCVCELSSSLLAWWQQSFVFWLSICTLWSSPPYSSIRPEKSLDQLFAWPPSSGGLCVWVWMARLLFPSSSHLWFWWQHDANNLLLPSPESEEAVLVQSEELACLRFWWANTCVGRSRSQGIKAACIHLSRSHSTQQATVFLRNQPGSNHWRRYTLEQKKVIPTNWCPSNSRASAIWPRDHSVETKNIGKLLIHHPRIHPSAAQFVSSLWYNSFCGQSIDPGLFKFEISSSALHFWNGTVRALTFGIKHLQPRFWVVKISLPWTSSCPVHTTCWHICDWVQNNDAFVTQVHHWKDKKEQQYFPL